MILPWQQVSWQRALAQRARLPHAVLMCGPAGGGKRNFAEALAQRLLCDVAQGDALACGTCDGCRWYASGNHPDMHRLIPDSEVMEESGENGEADSGKAKSQQIRIEQVRALQDALSVKGHRSALRVVIIDPAEAMHGPTANALLKSLEEPPQGVVFLLICDNPRRLLPTIRSRCQVWDFPRPPLHDCAPWLSEQHGGAANAALLGFCSGMPIAALQMLENGSQIARERFIKDIGGVPQKDALALAGEWESWLKAKQGAISLSELVLWLQRWICDCAFLAQGAQARFFTDCQDRLQQRAQAANCIQWLNCYNQIIEFKRIAQHPLNARLFLEDMLMRYARMFAKTTTAA